MRTPPICCEAHEEGGHGVEDRPLRTKEPVHHGGGTQRFQESSTKLARLRRFLSGRRAHGSTSPSGGVRSPQTNLSPKGNGSANVEKGHFAHMWSGGESGSGHSSDVMQLSDHNGGGLGVPVMVRALCDHMVNHGIDYETLMSEDWCPDRMRSSILSISYDEDSASNRGKGVTERSEQNANLIDSDVTAGLFRLYLEDLPRPIVDEEVVKDLADVFKDVRLGRFVNIRARSVLEDRLSRSNYELLKYLMFFFNRVWAKRDKDLSDPPGPTFGNLLSRIVYEEEESLFTMTEEEQKLFSTVYGSARTVGEVLVANCGLIFTSGDEDDADCNSEGSSSPGTSPLDNKFAELGDGDDSTTTSTDTDEFLSPPVSPSKTAFQIGGQPQAENRPRSTAEASESTDVYRSKKSSYSKSYLPSIIDLLSSPEDSWKDEVQRSSRTEFEDKYRYNNQCNNSDGSSEAEDPPLSSPPIPCPHEERRSSERFFHRGGGSTAGTTEQERKGARKIKKIKKRKHSKDRSYRVHSSGEEDETKEQFSHTLFGADFEEAPQTFNPIPSYEPINVTFPATVEEPLVEQEEQDTNEKGWVSDLLSSSEPVQSDHPWGLGDQACQDSYRRTARLYSREDEEETFLNPDGSLNITVSPMRAIELLDGTVNDLRKKIRKFEKHFVKNFGYKPTKIDKRRDNRAGKAMDDIENARKEISRIKESVADYVTSSTLVSFPAAFLSKYHQTTCAPPPPPPPPPPPAPPVEEVQERDVPNIKAKETLIQVLDHLEEKRKDAHRPQELTDMSSDQITEEKTALQRALLYYESIHGRPSTKEDRDFARPLYDRYRQVKRTMVRSNSRMKENLIELEPIIEHVEMEFTLTSPRHRGSLRDEDDFDDYSPSGSIVNQDSHPDFIPGCLYSPESSSKSPPSPKAEEDVYNLHSLPTEELKVRRREAKEQKKYLRITLREFEESFELANGRKVLKEDRGPLEGTYAEYKHAKAKLRLLEALLSKADRLRV